MDDYSNEHIKKLILKINTKKLIIFGLSYCGYTEKTKKYAKNHKISYKYYDIDKEYNIFFKLLSNINKLKPTIGINTDHSTFPIIFYKNKFIGSYDDLLKSNI